jgi:hypothetical protein
MELTAKNLDEPGEVVELPGLLEEVVEVGGFVVGREVVAPGWRWAKDTKRWTIGDEPCVTLNWAGLRRFFASKALLPLQPGLRVGHTRGVPRP